MQSALLRLLAVKFGPLSADTKRRVESADEAALDRWLEAVLTAQHVDELWRA